MKEKLDGVFIVGWSASWTPPLNYCVVPRVNDVSEVALYNGSWRRKPKKSKGGFIKVNLFRVLSYFYWLDIEFGLYEGQGEFQRTK